MKLNVSPYLFFDGCCEEALRFYAELMGGEMGAVMRFADAPDEEGCMPEGFDPSPDAVMHAEVNMPWGLMMGSDCPFYEKPQGFALTLGATSIEDAERLYEALKQGGEVKMPLEQTFFALRFAVVVDRFGTPWQIYHGEEMAS
ncbi:VOC family protein [Halomonas cupida]|uniref:PhnB protein n=1 Tax=Halomonas cupida TaxID=44933 RepID=A0A1M7C980_9GAMM|nr:VOC family protein [Halomonas cupida]GEN25151.1 VOC family protein [Halomonas cupida]SHL63737.1 PhnB protein [Halomonas cupida]